MVQEVLAAQVGLVVRVVALAGLDTLKSRCISWTSQWNRDLRGHPQGSPHTSSCRPTWSSNNGQLQGSRSWPAGLRYVQQQVWRSLRISTWLDASSACRENLAGSVWR